MAQILLIHSNKNVHDLININLTTYLGAHIIPRSNGEEAIALMEILPHVDMVVAEAQVMVDGAMEKTAEKLVQFIDDHNLDTELVLMGEFAGGKDGTLKNGLIVKNPLDWEGAVDAASKILGITLDDLKKKILPEYVPIASPYFHALHSSPCDVFIRIKQGEGQYQYLKRIHRDDTFELKDIQRYESQGLKYFFILKSERDAFATYVSNALVLRLEKEILEASADLDPATQLPVLGESHDLALRSIVDQGLNVSTIQLADTVIQGMISTTERSKVLGPLFRQIIGLPAGHFFKKGQITLMVALEILKLKNPALGLPSKEDATAKIAYAAFFTDLKLLEIEDTEQLEKLVMYDYPDLNRMASLDERTKGIIFGHALDGALFIRRNPEAPLDVDIIVKQHHGSMNGSGFKTEYAQLASLSRLFILCEAFARQFIYYSEKGRTDRPIILDMQERFQGHPTMEILVKALQEALKQRENRA
ncbi:MAG: hypothetical protein A2X86_10470 [Bdellovibrionales bacterium GWA2_49_15]|nr:MAG: hypothetical protein A2X86_10470 [Bdellovibrionales bacterium GWA2_49_15]HAZ14753.1 hypothetical protein [Bdellovibrionales bacterium]